MCMVMSNCGTLSSLFKKPPVVTKIETVKVKVPVFTCPDNIKNLDPPKRPTLYAKTLKESDKKDYKKIARTYFLDNAKLMNYAEELEINSPALKKLCETSENKPQPE